MGAHRDIQQRILQAGILKRVEETFAVSLAYSNGRKLNGLQSSVDKPTPEQRNKKKMLLHIFRARKPRRTVPLQVMLCLLH